MPKLSRLFKREKKPDYTKILEDMIKYAGELIGARDECEKLAYGNHVLLNKCSSIILTYIDYLKQAVKGKGIIRLMAVNRRIKKCKKKYAGKLEKLEIPDGICSKIAEWLEKRFEEEGVQ